MNNIVGWVLIINAKCIFFLHLTIFLIILRISVDIYLISKERKENNSYD